MRKERVELAETLESLLENEKEQAAYTDAGTTPPELPATDALIGQVQLFAENMVGYKELMMMYSCAIKEIRTKFDVLNTEFNVRYSRNPIYCISSRLKRSTSILQKLDRLKLPFTLSSVEKNLHDVAGVRVICSYTDDIYLIAEALLRQNDVELIAKKDYIAHPKDNGYRSLHLIVSVPVFFANISKKIEVEVQIRTIAMDYWASLEHQLKYKHRVPNEQNIARELRQCADTIAETDARMLAIRQEIEQNSNAPDRNMLLLEKLSRLDIALD